MTSSAITVTPGTTVKTAAALMAAHGFTLLPVVDEQRELVGVVNEGDLIAGRIPRDSRFPSPELDREPPPGATVEHVMTAEVVSAHVWDDLRELVARMRAEGVRAAPVCRDRRVQGVVTLHDLICALARADDRLANDARRRLALCFSPTRFEVSVQDGHVVLTDRRAHPEEWRTAQAVVEQIPGVVRARVVAAADDPRTFEPTNDRTRPPTQRPRCVPPTPSIGHRR